MKKLAVVFLALAVVFMAGFAPAQEPAPETQVTGEKELVKQKGKFQETWVRPDADINQYSKLYVWKPVYNFRDIDPAPRTMTSTQMLRNQDGPYGVREESRAKFEEVVTKTFVKEFQRSKMFEIVDTVGPDTLIVRPGVLDIVSDVPPEDVGRGEVYLASVGEATILFDMIDAETGVIQARVAERRRIQPPGTAGYVASTPTNRATIWKDLEYFANAAAMDMRKALEKAKKKASKN